MTVKINADTSDGLKLESDTSGTVDIQSNGTSKISVTSSDVTTPEGVNIKMHGSSSAGTTGGLWIRDLPRVTNDTSTFELTYINSDDTIIFTKGSSATTSSNSEKMRLANAGELMVGTTDGSPWNNTSAAGAVINAVGGGAGLISCARVSGDPLAVNRVTDDGNVVAIYAQGSLEGTISVSGSTTSYNAFTGSHWSRLADNSKPTILKGTVMETIDTMCDWYELVFTNKEGIEKKIEIALPDGKSSGDSHTMDYNGESVTGVIRDKDDDKHCMSKVSDTEDSTSVYGVFMAWNTETNYNDMYINALGTSLVRVASGVTVSKGDLLSSKGDGTAKLQGDDIIKTKTIGKVLSNVKKETYGDGSYTVPCALYCG